MSNALLMPFLDESETFVLGFECGQIWEKIQEGEVLTSYVFHTKNSAQIKMICETFGIDFEVANSDSDWSFLTTKSIL